jgi:hypothetical protein
MPVYDRHSIPNSVSRGTLDLELKKWLPTGPTLGADVLISSAGFQAGAIKAARSTNQQRATTSCPASSATTTRTPSLAWSLHEYRSQRKQNLSDIYSRDPDPGTLAPSVRAGAPKITCGVPVNAGSGRTLSVR